MCVLSIHSFICILYLVILPIAEWVYSSTLLHYQLRYCIFKLNAVLYVQFFCILKFKRKTNYLIFFWKIFWPSQGFTRKAVASCISMQFSSIWSMDRTLPGTLHSPKLHHHQTSSSFYRYEGIKRKKEASILSFFYKLNVFFWWIHAYKTECVIECGYTYIYFCTCK